MILKIKNIKVKNFKVFPSLSLDLTSSNLTLLDGPNGFGKTSFYDALELLLIGNISRYKDLDSKVSNQRKAIGGYPLVYDAALPEDELSIEVDFDCAIGPITLKRCATKSKLDKFKRISDVKMDLLVLNNGIYEKVEHEESLLSSLLGDNYRKNYGLFHYIEQEENTTILKGKGESKQQKIDHLFDVSEYRSKISKLVQVQKKIAPLKSPTKEKELREISKKLESLKSSLLPEMSKEIDYFRLIETSEQAWDKETLQFTPGVFTNWISENGILITLKNLRQNAQHIVNQKYNDSIEKKLSLVDKAVEPLLKYGNNLGNIESYKSDIKLYDESLEFLELAKGGIISLCEKNRAIPPTSVLNSLPEEFNIDNYRAELDTLSKSLKSSGKLEQSLSKLIKSKENYIIDFSSYQNSKDSKDSKCPTCGHDWIKHEELIASIESQESVLHDILASNKTTLQETIINIENKFLSLIVEGCNQATDVKKYIIEYKRSIINLSQQQVNFLENCIKNYSEYNIPLDAYLSTSMDLKKPTLKNELINVVQQLYKPVDHTLLTSDIKDLFTSLFNGNEDELMKLTIESINNKITFVKQQYEKSKLVELEKQKNTYNTELSKFRNATNLWNELKSLIELYNSNINRYIESISRGIEVLFHIYSGRLLQNFQNGLGIFIDTDGKSISFKENPNKEHDVIFSMSSGQLSSLVIAFSMALNNKYAKNPLLLIDDPVQTMDEINVAGFIDLLRHEFKERQIFISTHEDHTSSYFRYKFRKANLDTQRINFKDEAFKLSNQPMNKEAN
ncbi:AAA family ATPase [Vibrio splendidus]